MAKNREKYSVAVQMQVMEPVTEHVRCVRLATGQVIFEFWAGAKRIGRVDANAYETALEMAREHIQDEEVPEVVEVALAKNTGPDRSPDV